MLRTISINPQKYVSNFYNEDNKRLAFSWISQSSLILTCLTHLKLPDNLHVFHKFLTKTSNGATKHALNREVFYRWKHFAPKKGFIYIPNITFHAKY